MACRSNPGPVISTNLARTGLSLSCYNTSTNGSGNGTADLDYYLCRLLKNHAFLPNEDQRLNHDAMMVYSNTIIVLVGIVLNMLTICVLARERRYSPSILLLQCLSVVDTLFLVLNLLTFGIPVLILTVEGVTCTINPYLAIRLNVYENSIAGKILNQLSQSMRIMAVGMMVIVTTDRCLAIFYPLHAKRFCTFRAAKAQVGVLVLYTMVWFGLFNALDYVHSSHKFRAFAVSSIVNLIIPALIVFVLNLKLIRTLHLSKSMRETMNASSNGRGGAQHSPSFEYASLTAKLVAIASTFSICVIPSILIAVNWMLTTNLGSDCCLSVQVISKMNLVNILLMNISSSVNFIFYILMGWRFRRAFYRMMCWLCVKEYRHERITMKTMSVASKTQITNSMIHRGSNTGMELTNRCGSEGSLIKYSRCNTKPNQTDC